MTGTSALSPPVRVGVVGCGNVSRQYLANLVPQDETGPTDPDDAHLVVVACADAESARADEVARAFGIAQTLSVDELVASAEVDLVLNLTSPSAHAAVSMAAVRAGKHVYTEKPLATSVVDARALLDAADAAGVSVGCAPDTFLGPGLSRCRELVLAGTIGTPVSANAFSMGPGPEAFHPQPDFLYQPGAGPLFDGGPYAVSALVSLLGPVAAVTGMATTGSARRTVRTGRRAGETFAVEVPTHVSALLRFAGGAIATLVMSFDVQGTRTPRLEIHGTEASLVCPAPNSWGGPAVILPGGSADPVTVVVSGGDGNRIGLGIAQMAAALRAGSRPAASGDRGLHVLEVLDAIHRSAESGGETVALDPPRGEIDVRGTTW